MSVSRESLRFALRYLQQFRMRSIWSSRPFITFTALGGGATAAYLLKYRSIDIPAISVFPHASAHSASTEVQSASQSEAEAEEKYEEPKISVMYDFFIAFASLEYEGVPYLTPVDFIESLVEDHPRKPRKRRVLTARELRTLQKRAPPKGLTSHRLFRDQGSYGLISYSEYLFLMHVLTKTDRSLRVAFQVLDVDGNGRIDKKEFLFLQFLIDEEKRLARAKVAREREEEAANDANKENAAPDSDWFVVKLLDRARSYVSNKIDTYTSGAAPAPVTASGDELSDSTSDSQKSKEDDEDDRKRAPQLTRTYRIPPNAVETTLLIHFFGKDGRQLLDYADFCTFTENLQMEALEAEFQKYVGHHADSCEKNEQPNDEHDVIHVRDFARILFRHTEYARYCDSALLEGSENVTVSQTDNSVEPQDAVTSAIERAKMEELSAHSLRSDFVLKMASRLESLKPADRHITFEQFCRFNQLFKHLDDLKVAVKLYGLQHTKITRTLFQRAFHAVTGNELDSLITEVLFKMFDVNQDGSLSHDEFLSVMRERVQRHVHVAESHPHEALTEAPSAVEHASEGLNWEDFKSCLKTEIRKMK